MSFWMRVLLLNLAALIGIVVSLFMVPENTPFWLWATIAGIFLLVWNVPLFRQRRRTPETSGRSTRTIMAALGFALLIIDLILSRDCQGK
jgi:hypothetical protein